jgi:hypothetical protein
MFRKTLIAATAALTFAATAAADNHNGKAPVYTANLTEAEVIAAQNAWGEALVAIGKAYEQGGRDKARDLAEDVIDSAYGYNLGPVLFKPTLTEVPQTFRTTREGALAYFVGGDKAFPNDSGFALKGWQKVEIRNAGIHINGDVASTMGNVMLTGKDGKVTTVDKTWKFKKTDDGKLRIVLHHSSLPYSS